MKNTFCSVTLGAAALALVVTLPAAPASAKTRHSSKMHAKKHTMMHKKMHTMTHTMMHATMPAASRTATPAPGNAGPARTGTGPSPTTGRVLGRVPSAVGDAGGQVDPPSPPTGGGITR